MLFPVVLLAVKTCINYMTDWRQDFVYAAFW